VLQKSRERGSGNALTHTRENVLGRAEDVWRSQNLRKAVVDGDFTCNQDVSTYEYSGLDSASIVCVCEGLKSFSS